MKTWLESMSSDSDTTLAETKTAEVEDYSCCHHTLLLPDAWARFLIARNRWLQ
jgi:hypothetical protein